MGCAQVKAGFGRKLLFLEGDSQPPRTVPALILASTSRYRRELLARLGVPFEVSAPKVAEGHEPDESPGERALRLATLKAHAVAQRHPQAIVIGSDQVASCGAQILDKPGDAARCRSQLASLSGRSAQFHTACTVVHAASGRQHSHTDRTQVTFRTLTAAEIARYVEREQPFDCAGGFKAESLGIALFTALETCDPSALIGLPLIWLAGVLREHGWSVP
jgi:septum formation protein